MNAPQNKAQQTRQALLDQQDRLVVCLRLARACLTVFEQHSPSAPAWTREMDDALGDIDLTLDDFVGDVE